MPSGHAQSSFFSNVYLWLVTGSMGYFLSGLFIASITVYQRWRDKRHTIQQLALGAIVGTLFAYGSYYMLSKKILQ
jgi:membrane-associated phospholipid phosphatase